MKKPEWIDDEGLIAYIKPDYLKTVEGGTAPLTPGDFALALEWLVQNGFTEYYGMDHELGYYDSVENIRMGFMKKTKRETYLVRPLPF